MEQHADGRHQPHTESSLHGAPCGEQIDVDDLAGAHADLSAFCRDLLRVVAVIEYKTAAKPTGAKIMEKIQDDYSRDIPHSVYNRLTDLADRGLIEKQPYIAQTKLYTLTPAGKEVLRVYMESIEELLQVFAVQPFEELEMTDLESGL